MPRPRKRLGAEELLAMLEWLGLTLVGLTIVGSCILVIVAVWMAYTLRTHFSLRHEALALETRLLAHPLPLDDRLPHVVVQIPVFNEGAVVGRAIASCSALDWPRDKLHIQICDDSTDETTGLAKDAMASASATGINIAICHRDNRSGFKAGALHAAMAATSFEYFAILDVDYVPAPDFLRRCMAVLIAEPTLAFVQARPDYLNPRASMFTRAQAIILDYHYGIEQTTRSWSGPAVPFNGTCGIWRRAAIEAGGGWRGDTLTEDWDLTYRALLNGWRGQFLSTVTVPGELPTSLTAWFTQQKRWATGVGQVAWRTLPALVRNRRVSGTSRWGAMLPLVAWLGYLTFSATILLALTAMMLQPSTALTLGLIVYATVVALAVALFALMLAANRFLRPRTAITSFIVDFPAALALAAYISWANLRSLPGTLTGRPREFVRTPKQGSTAT